MRNNPYKNLIKALTPKKSDLLIIERDDDTIYMTNGHIAFRFALHEYSAYIHAEKPLVFPIIESGTCIRNGEIVSMNLKQLFNRHFGYEYDAKPTSFLKEFKTGEIARMYLIETESGQYVPLILNEIYHQTVSGLSCKVYCNGKNNAPIWYENDVMLALLLPITYGMADLTEHGKALETLSHVA